MSKEANPQVKNIKTTHSNRTLFWDCLSGTNTEMEEKYSKSRRIVYHYQLWGFGVVLSHLFCGSLYLVMNNASKRIKWEYFFGDSNDRVFITRNTPPTFRLLSACPASWPVCFQIGKRGILLRARETVFLHILQCTYFHFFPFLSCIFPIAGLWRLGLLFLSSFIVLASLRRFGEYLKQWLSLENIKHQSYTRRKNVQKQTLSFWFWAWRRSVWLESKIVEVFVQKFQSIYYLLHFPQFCLVLLNLCSLITTSDTLCSRPWIHIWLTVATVLPLTEIIQYFFLCLSSHDFLDIAK